MAKTLDPSAELPLTETTYYILISLFKPLHGYGIMQNIENLTEGAISIGPGTLYGAIKNLVKKKIIEQVEGTGTESRGKKSYILSPFGKRIVEMEVCRLSQLARLGSQAIKEEGGSGHE